MLSFFTNCKTLREHEIVKDILRIVNFVDCSFFSHFLGLKIAFSFLSSEDYSFV